MVGKGILSKLLFSCTSLLMSLVLCQGIALADDYYVNAGLGTDNPSHGGSPGIGAWKTITYALSQVSGSEGNPATIHVAVGTYDSSLGETFPLNMEDYVSLQGDGQDLTTIDFGQSEIDGCIVSDNVNNYSIDGFKLTGSKYSGIYLDNASSPTISNCTITGSSASLEAIGIACGNASSPTITHCTITGGDGSWYGGIIYLVSCSPTITHCTITGNSSSWMGGGGILCGGSSPEITNCTITGNTSNDGYGGGIWCEGSSSPMITNCTITGNSTITGDFGGGIYCTDSSSLPTIADCNISGNTATAGDHGGGIYCNDSSPVITNCIMKENSADLYGGGIFCQNSSSPTITNCTITGNSATNGYGGGIYCTGSSSPQITNCTITENNASSGFGGGLWCQNLSSPTVTNCILWNNDDLASISGTSTPVVSYSCIEFGYTGTGNISSDPLFVGLEDYHLSYDSPCIDAGTSEDAPDSDFDSEDRPFDVPGVDNNEGLSTFDMGSDEFVDSDGDEKADYCDNCPYHSNPMQEDILDGDGVGDICDNAPGSPNGPDLGTCVMDVGGVIVSYRVGEPPEAIYCTIDDHCVATGGFCQTYQGDYNANGIGDAGEGYADVDSDGGVNLADLIVLIDEYGRTDCNDDPQPEFPCQFDINDDGRVSSWDFLILLLQYGGDGYET